MSDSLRLLWTVAYHVPPSIGFSRQEYWSGLPFSFSGGSSQLRDWTRVSHIPARRFNLWATREVPKLTMDPIKILTGFFKKTCQNVSTVCLGKNARILLKIWKMLQMTNYSYQILKIILRYSSLKIIWLVEKMSDYWNKNKYKWSLTAWGPGC